MSKSFWKSKTVWFNLITVLVTVASYFGYTPDQQVADNTAGMLLILGPVVNVLLRFMTKHELTLK